MIDFIANLLLSVPVKELLKSIYICLHVGIVCHVTSSGLSNKADWQFFYHWFYFIFLSGASVKFIWKTRWAGQIARREAARHRKSECKVNLDILNSSRSSASKRFQKLYLRTTWRMDLRQLTACEHFGCVSMREITFFVCGPKFITWFTSPL